jgi:hypothetical protein
MAAHGAGSLLMELARLASSVHVAGAAAPAPAFLNDLLASSGPGSAGDRDVSGETAFLAPPLVYLDPRGGTQPLSGMGARPNLLSGVVNWPAATNGGAPFGAGAAQVAGSMPPGAPRPRAAPAPVTAPGTAPVTAATLEARRFRADLEYRRIEDASRRAAESDRLAVRDRFAVIDALSDGLSRNLRRLQAEVRAAHRVTPEVRSEQTPNGTPSGTPNARGPARALRGGLGALGGAARFALRRLFFFRRREVAARDRTRDPTEDFPERAGGGYAHADVPLRRHAVSSSAAGTG